MIGSAREFFTLVRTSGGDKLLVDDEAAIATLQALFEEHRAMAASLPQEKREAALFWSGGVIGVRIALRGYMMRLRAAAHEAKVPIEEAT